jgi:hypothetical protein
MFGTRQRRLAAGIGLVGLAVMAALSGCSSGADSGGTSARDNAAQPQGAGAAGAPEAQPPAAGKDVPADLRIDQRSIIYTGSISIRVDDVDRAAARTVSIATTAGGFVGGDQRSRGEGLGQEQATLQLRIPAARFTPVVDEIGDLGDEERREINTQDVTEEVVDLDARIATQRARVDSGRRLLAQAKTLTDLVSLESEVAKREADLASLEAKKRRLDDLTALSTITVTLLGPDAANEPNIGFLAGLSGGWTAFVGSLQVLLTVLGALLPWLVLLGGPIAAALWVFRRQRRRGVPRTGPVAPAPVAPAPIAPPAEN